MVLCFTQNEDFTVNWTSSSRKERSKIFAIMLLLLSLSERTTGFQLRRDHVFITFVHRKFGYNAFHPTLFSSDDWSNFQSFDDDDEIVFGRVLDKQEYAEENDSQDVKESVGSLRAAPVVERDAEPICVVAGKVNFNHKNNCVRSLPKLLLFTHSTFALGSQLELTEDTVLGVLAACRNELGTLFGYTAENRGVGITGGVDYVDLDGPSVIVRLKGRFWHTRPTVLDRVANYLQQRIPEIVDVQIEDPWQLTDEANDVW